MNILTKALTGAAAAALVTLSATPAQAQSYPYPDPYGRDYGRSSVDVGSIVRGVAVAGAAAAAVGAITNAVRGGYGGYGNGGYSYPNSGGYGYPNNGSNGYPNSGVYGNGGYDSRYGGGYERYAIDACGQTAGRYGRVNITDVDRKGSRSYRVRGVIDANQSYDRYSRYNQRQSFACTARDDGRVTDFDLNR